MFDLFDLITLSACAVLPAWACSPLSPLLLTLAVFVLLQLLDAWSTHRALAAGGQEANPIARFFMGWLGVVPGLLVLKALVGVWLWLLLPHLPAGQVLWVLWAVNAIYIVVVVNNIFVALGKNMFADGGDA